MNGIPIRGQQERHGGKGKGGVDPRVGTVCFQWEEEELVPLS